MSDEPLEEVLNPPPHEEHAAPEKDDACDANKKLKVKKKVTKIRKVKSAAADDGAKKKIRKKKKIKSTEASPRDEASSDSVPGSPIDTPPVSARGEEVTNNAGIIEHSVQNPESNTKPEQTKHDNLTQDGNQISSLRPGM